MKTISRFLSYCDSYGMLPRGERIMCAVSGGSDSTAMLCMLMEAAPERELQIEAAHFNHRLRGEESDRDEEFVREFCLERGIPLHSGSGDVAAVSDKTGKGIEETARKLRYEFLESAARRSGCGAVATGHTADDNAETVIMNLLRGSGARGLAGIPPRRGSIIRPVLCFTRSELRGYLAEKGVGYVEDSTNEDRAYTRNRIRLEVMPVIRELNPSCAGDILSACELLRRDDAFLDGLAVDYLAAGPVGKIDAGSLCALPLPVASRVIRLAAPGDTELTRERIETVLEFAKSGRSGTAVQLPGGFEARLDQGILSFSRSADACKIERFDLKPGKTDIPGTRWTVSCSYRRAEPGDTCTKYRFAVKGGCTDLNIRSRQEKDALTLKYRGGTRTLKKLFIEARIPVRERGLVPVLASGPRAIAVPGFGIDEHFRAKAGECAYIINFSEE
ncbi:MAG: tRNA lysidine(34) synthetase TilS [Clostridiales bacterium]|nr:tRNA lysidine(34) synthetase TilS [Clostridiales bacterium]